jgi:hypothetical protein
MPVPFNPAEMPLFDVGNPGIRTDLSAHLLVGKVPTPDGKEAGFATIRQGNTTMSVPLDRKGADEWSRIFAQLRDMLSESGLAVASAPRGIVPAVQGQLR